MQFNPIYILKNNPIYINTLNIYDLTSKANSKMQEANSFLKYIHFIYLSEKVQHVFRFS
jgi:hypothetical protein